MARMYEVVDGMIRHRMFETLEKVKGENMTISTLTEGWVGVDSPTPLLLTISVYLIFVLGGLAWIKLNNLQPRQKEPALLRAFVLFHNFVCFALSLYMCVGILVQAVVERYSLWGNAYKPEQIEMGKLIYIFYMSKYLEFFDTVIMILKRNTRQVTFLHVYHHVSISLIWWVIAHHAPGGEAYFSAFLNSGVHVAMYLYYLLSVIIGKDEKSRRKYLFWGKYLTQLQMFQFVLNMLQAYYDLKTSSPYPRFLIQTLFYYMISLLILFANFYAQKHLLTKGSKRD